MHLSHFVHTLITALVRQQSQNTLLSDHYLDGAVGLQSLAEVPDLLLHV